MEDLPHNLSAEAAVIGSVMYDNHAYERVRDLLTPDSFYSGFHGDVWAAVQDLLNAGRVADGVTLSDRFPGDDERLASLLDHAAFGPEVQDYARMVADSALRRELVTAGQALSMAAHTGTGEAALDEHDATLERVRDKAPNQATIESSASAAVSAMEEDEAFALVQTGYPTLDSVMGGFERGAMSIIAARPGIGKSAFAVCIMQHVSQNESVGFISLDMNGRIVNQRLACYSAWRSGKHVPLVSDLRTGRATPAQRQMLVEAISGEAGQQCFVDHRPGLSVANVNNQIRAWKRHCKKFGLPPLGAVIVDHIGKVYPSQKYGTLYEKTSYVSNEMLEVAKQHEHVATICLAQLNRETAKGKRRPTIADIRDSGKIEEDASAIVMLHREDYYLALDAKNEALEQEERAIAQRKLLQHKGQLEVIIGKNRNGEPCAELLTHSIGHNVIRDPSHDLQERAA